MSLETISTSLPPGELHGDRLPSGLPGPEATGSVWFCSIRTGKEEEEEGTGDTAGGPPRFILGGTGGTTPPASVRDKLRLGLLLPAWLDRRQGVVDMRSEESAAVGVSPEDRPSNTVKQMDSWESLLGGGGADSGVGQKWTGAVLRRLKTVLGLGTGFTAGRLLPELVSMVARFGTELFLNTSKLTDPVSDTAPSPRSDEGVYVTD